MRFYSLIISLWLLFGFNNYLHSQNNFPLNIQGLNVWLKADSVQQTGGKVSTWYDVSGKNFHLTQSVAGSSPSVVSNAILTYPALSFDGNDILNSPNLNSLNCEIFMVAKGNETNNEFLGLGNGYFVNFLTNKSILYLENSNYRYFTPTQPTGVFQIHDFGFTNVVINTRP